MDDDKEWGTAAAPTPAQLDDKFISAVQAWLSIPPSEVQDLRASMLASPLNFVAKYINSLPSQLLVPFAEVTTPQERSRIALVMYRRQSWARRAERLSGDGGQDDKDATTAFGLEASRRRLPELWSSIVGSTTRPRLRHFPTPRRRPAARQLDPPFPDHPAAAVSGYKAAAGTTSSIQYGPAHEGDLFSHPRLARLMDEQDEEEEEERQREERDGLHGAEVEEGEDEEEDDEQIQEELVQVFQRAVVERFIKGDVSQSGRHLGRGINLTASTLLSLTRPSQPYQPPCMRASTLRTHHRFIRERDGRHKPQHREAKARLAVLTSSQGDRRRSSTRSDILTMTTAMTTTTTDMPVMLMEVQWTTRCTI